jgi:hypothetical protein
MVKIAKAVFPLLLTSVMADISTLDVLVEMHVDANDSALLFTCRRGRLMFMYTKDNKHTKFDKDHQINSNGCNIYFTPYFNISLRKSQLSKSK